MSVSWHREASLVRRPGSAAHMHSRREDLLRPRARLCRQSPVAPSPTQPALLRSPPPRLLVVATFLVPFGFLLPVLTDGFPISAP